MYNVFIDDCLKHSKKNRTLASLQYNEADLQDLKLEGPGPFNLQKKMNPY